MVKAFSLLEMSLFLFLELHELHWLVTPIVKTTWLDQQSFSLTTRPHVSKIRKHLNGKSLTDAIEEKSLPVCWKDKKPLKTLDEAKKYFKTITLRFGNQKNGQLFQEK